MAKRDTNGARRPRPKAIHAPRPRRSRTLPIVVLAVIGIALAAVAAFMLAGGDETSSSSAAFTGETYRGGGRLAVDRALIDEGDVPYGQKVDANFKLKNVGDEALALNQPTVKTLEGCWPPKPVIGRMTLQPGEETTLNVQFSMHEGMGGPHKFEVKVPSNDPVEPTTTVTIAANYPKP